jgi:hypothetical protein
LGIAHGRALIGVSVKMKLTAYCLIVRVGFQHIRRKGLAPEQMDEKVNLSAFQSGESGQ